MTLVGSSSFGRKRRRRWAETQKGIPNLEISSAQKGKNKHLNLAKKLPLPPRLPPPPLLPPGLSPVSGRKGREFNFLPFINHSLPEKNLPKGRKKETRRINEPTTYKFPPFKKEMLAPTLDFTNKMPCFL